MPFTIWGIGLVLLKLLVDRLVARFLGRTWEIQSCLVPGKGLFELYDSDAGYFGVLLLVSFPFLLSSVILTLNRLRSAGMPCWLALLFPVPILNLILFAFLCILPERAHSEETEVSAPRPSLKRLIPESRLLSALVAALCWLPLAAGATLLAVEYFQSYGRGVFVGLPFALGFLSASVHACHETRTLRAMIGVAFLSVALLGALLVLVAVEGAICVLMAAPLAFLFSIPGAMLAHALASERHRRARNSFSASLLVWPLLVGLESLGTRQAELIPLRSRVFVEAAREKVWKHVIEFSPIGEEPEWIFRAGVAYPVDARIEEEGVGAVRYCRFNLGSFVEPIEVWEPPRLLRFAVTEQPRPMQEWSPYGEIAPPHLEG